MFVTYGSEDFCYTASCYQNMGGEGWFKSFLERNTQGSNPGPESEPSLMGKAEVFGGTASNPFWGTSHCDAQWPGEKKRHPFWVGSQDPPPPPQLE